MDSNLNKFFTQLNLDDIYIEKFKDSKILSIIYKKSLKKFHKKSLKKNFTKKKKKTFYVFFVLIFE